MDPRRILLLVVIGFLASYAWWRYEHREGRAPEKFTPAAAPKLDLGDVKVLAALDAEYTRLIHEIVPSVVSITSAGYVAAPQTLQDLLLGQRRVQRAGSAGSGVIVSKEGHILTNHHVIAGMSELQVQLSDGRKFAARPIGSDPATDIAVLHIDAKNIEPLALGESDKLLLGQQVFAIGNPLSLGESVSRGVVSARDRAINDSGIEFLQHDAAVNPGNSGGPLVNIRGEVIGINSQIASNTGRFQGISFAIPSNTAQRVLENIIARGRIARVWIGIQMQNLTPRLAANFGVPDTDGVLITDVVSGAPADQAGLRAGDVIRSIGGKAVKNADGLRAIQSTMKPGEIVELQILRGGRAARANVQIGEVPAQFLVPQP